MPSTIPTFAARWARAVERGPQRPFLVWEGSGGSVTTWTYAEFDALAGRAAGTLAASGVREGGAVHLALANSPAFVAVWLAAVRLGAHIVPCDPQAAVTEVAHQLRRTRPAVSVASPRRSGIYEAACAGTGVTLLLVDEDDVALPMFGHGPPPVPHGRDHVHLGHDQQSQGGRGHPGQLRLRR
jgi:crotonobetaine/carnitine-CoA ligase